MCRRAVLLCALTLALAFPLTASANRFTAVSYELTDEHAVINLESDAPVGVPRIGTPGGMVKAWFDDMEHSSIRVEGDGDVFRYLRVRPGAQGSGLLTLRLTDNRNLERAAIDIQRDGTQTRILIPRAQLPGAPEGSVIAAIEAAVGESTETDDEAAAAEAPILPLGAVDADSPQDSVISEESDYGLATGRGADVGIMVFVSILLGFVYIFVRFFMKKTAKAGPVSDIEIISTKRIGSKHQLLVVRALGEDHLLSINAGRTDRITSLPTPESAYSEPVEMSAPAMTESPDSAPNEGLMSRIQQRLGFPSQRPTEPAPSTPRIDEERVSLSQAAKMKAFGQELRRAEGAAKAPSSPPNGSSDAVAGLIRLRERRAQL